MNGVYRGVVVEKLDAYDVMTDTMVYALKLHVENAPDAAPSGKTRPSGRHEIGMFDMLKVMAPSGTVNYEDLVAGYVAKMPKGSEGKDNRKRDAKRAVEGLIAKRLCYMHENDRVSLTSLVTSGDDGWLG